MRAEEPSGGLPADQRPGCPAEEPGKPVPDHGAHGGKPPAYPGTVQRAEAGGDAPDPHRRDGCCPG